MKKQILIFVLATLVISCKNNISTKEDVIYSKIYHIADSIQRKEYSANHDSLEIIYDSYDANLYKQHLLEDLLYSIQFKTKVNSLTDDPNYKSDISTLQKRFDSLTAAPVDTTKGNNFYKVFSFTTKMNSTDTFTKHIFWLDDNLQIVK